MRRNPNKCIKSSSSCIAWPSNCDWKRLWKRFSLWGYLIKMCLWCTYSLDYTWRPKVERKKEDIRSHKRARGGFKDWNLCHWGSDWCWEGNRSRPVWRILLRGNFKFLWQNLFYWSRCNSQVPCKSQKSHIPKCMKSQSSLFHSAYLIIARLGATTYFNDSSQSQQRECKNNFIFLANVRRSSRLSPRVSGINTAGLHIKPFSVSCWGMTRRRVLFSRAKTFNTHHRRRHALAALHTVPNCSSHFENTYKT